MNELKDRIRAERKRMKLSQDALAKRVDQSMGQSFISNLENGLRSETPFFPELAEIFGVSAYWLKTGKGQRSPNQLNEEEQRLVAGFRLLGQEAQEMWLMTADAKISEAAKQTNKGRLISLADYRRSVL